MNNYYKISLGLFGLLALGACNNDDDNTPTANPEPTNLVQLQAHSQSPALLDVAPEFSGINVYTLLSSEDQLVNTPNFVYGSMADGAGLLRNSDNTFTLINNIEADYSIARITLDETFKPVAGEYILNAQATAATAQCSGSMITPEEHGFGPLYLSGGEWGGSSQGVFATDPYKDASSASVATMLNNMGQWDTENAVAIGKDAYPGKTVVFIGDDHSDNTVPSGQLGMYVGNTGDLTGGQLYGLRVTDANVNFEMDMEEGQTYAIDFVELEETQKDLLDAECKNKGVIGFSRLEDIDWRRGSAANNREIYFCVTGRQKPDLIGKGSVYGRVYKVNLNPNDPTGAGTITCVLDGDKLDGIAKDFSSPDNIVVTENFAYIQEDPNGYFDTADKTHFARLYQYDLNTGTMKVVLECDQVAAQAQGYGTVDSIWEITGMIDISDIVGKEDTFLMMTQNHGWEPADGSAFTDPNANPAADSRKEGSMLYILEGLDR
ncbi:phosphatase [Mangrovimonas sp. CR14]|uniref:alkaline phosphatase PhoX n=1 Tax=Mangrovimonas sp. CR14 TaxID=2706120 RepID=UPI001422278F|nr:alkaline phosphatase PhoX [Mangrovimonas sp. CR14]NIK91727.1 phosphatase [Mangrovimonas sp. CR14]